MPLDDDVREFLKEEADHGTPPLWEVPIEDARATLRDGAEALPRTPVARVEARAFAGPAGQVPLRIYTPSAQALLPALVYFHGGGFVFGDLVTHDETARRLAVGADAVVVAVDYRRAPEAPFPAAVEDAEAATRWVARHATELGADPSRLVVIGDSAGGNLAAVVARRLRDAGDVTLAGQALIYPATDMVEAPYPSREANAEGYGLTTAEVAWFGHQYLGAGDPARVDATVRRHPDASPLRAADLSGLPPAFVLTTEYDPLRDEGEAYAQRLREAGVSVDHRRLDGTIHGIFSNPRALASKEAAWALVLAWLERVLDEDVPG